MTLTHAQFARRRAELLAKEAKEPLGWWWLSFADPYLPKGNQFLGVAVVEARGMAGAIDESWRLKINPGGQVLGIRLPDERIPPIELRERLLSRSELEEAGLA